MGYGWRHPRHSGSRVLPCHGAAFMAPPDGGEAERSTSEALMNTLEAELHEAACEWVGHGAAISSRTGPSSPEAGDPP